MAKQRISGPIGREEQCGPGCSQRLGVIRRRHAHGIGQGMIESPLGFFKRSSQQFSFIRTTHQTSGPMDAIVRQTLDENGVFKTQLTPVRLNLSDQLRPRSPLRNLRLVGHGAFHW